MALKLWDKHPGVVGYSYNQVQHQPQDLGINDSWMAETSNTWTKRLRTAKLLQIWNNVII